MVNPWMVVIAALGGLLFSVALFAFKHTLWSLETRDRSGKPKHIYNMVGWYIGLLAFGVGRILEVVPANYQGLSFTSVSQLTSLGLVVVLEALFLPDSDLSRTDYAAYALIAAGLLMTAPLDQSIHGESFESIFALFITFLVLFLITVALRYWVRYRLKTISLADESREKERLGLPLIIMAETTLFAAMVATACRSIVHHVQALLTIVSIYVLGFIMVFIAQLFWLTVALHDFELGYITPLYHVYNRFWTLVISFAMSRHSEGDAGTHIVMPVGGILLMVGAMFVLHQFRENYSHFRQVEKFYLRVPQDSIEAAMRRHIKDNKGDLDSQGQASQGGTVVAAPAPNDFAYSDELDTTDSDVGTDTGAGIGMHRMSGTPSPSEDDSLSISLDTTFYSAPSHFSQFSDSGDDVPDPGRRPGRRRRDRDRQPKNSEARKRGKGGREAEAGRTWRLAPPSVAAGAGDKRLEDDVEIFGGSSSVSESAVEVMKNSMSPWMWFGYGRGWHLPLRIRTDKTAQLARADGLHICNHHWNRKKRCLFCGCFFFIFICTYIIITFTLMMLLYRNCHQLHDGRTDWPRPPLANISGPDVMWTHVRQRGNHNSFHKIPLATFPAFSTGIEAWQFAHESFEVQLNRGNRVFEIDLHIRGRSIAVYHVQLWDDQSGCSCFLECLRVLREWSERHPGHAPIVVSVEVKTLWQEDLVMGLRGVSWNDLMLIEEHIAAVWGDRVFTPDEFRGSHPNLTAAAAAGRWPTLDAMRGRMIVILDDKGKVRDLYRHRSPILENRLIFTASKGFERFPDTAVLMVNDPTEDREFNYIRDGIAEGFLVRTRADSNEDPSTRNDVQRLQRALDSGAQIISFDWNVHEKWAKHVSLAPLACIDGVATPHCYSATLTNYSHLAPP